jgi:1,4-alpha-glucan branching enzyme
MWWKITLTIAWMLVTFVTTQALAVEVTFRVDMSEQTVSPLGVHIAGNFQEWNPGSTEMMLTQNNIFAYTAELTAGEAIEYKFINGNDWGMDEQVPPGCALNNNRFLTVPAQNVVLDAYCFGSCTICNPPLVEITFQVDMSNETVSADGVHVAGSFQEPPWQPGATLMTLAGNNVYQVTVAMEAGGYYEYKFINGNDWGFDETVPPPCANGMNRYLIVPPVPTTLEAVCFGSCYPCGPPPIDIQVTFRVDMSEQTLSPDGVHIAGGFQGWLPGATPMADAGNNIYTYTATMSSGSYNEFKYINGTTWEESENVPEACGVNNNRYITLPQNDTILALVCYASCDPCGPPPVDVAVTFAIDMTNEVVSSDGVHLAGSFQGWNASSTPLAATGNGIYSTTVVLPSESFQEYKFINGITFDDAEAVPESCGIPDGLGGFNRYFTVPVNDTTLPALCFGSCEPCVPPLPEHAVTFRVDMSYQTVAPEGVHLAGTFQGWNPAGTPMTLTANNIYEVTLMLEEDAYHEFKFINGITFDAAEIVPPECAQNNNRFITIPHQNTILPAWCFGSCELCGPPPTEVEITFVVDMANETVSAQGVHLVGDFQAWNPATTAMTNIGDAVYATTFILASDTYHEYKFINGNTWDDQEVVPAACANNNNRYFTVPDQPDTLTNVCFGSCFPCGITPPQIAVTFRVDMVNETVSADGVHLAADFQEWDPEATPMLLEIGDIYTYTTTLEAGSYHEFKFINGNNWGDDEMVPAACAANNNRYFTVPQEPVVLTAFCFASCDTCIIDNIHNPAGNLQNGVVLFPNPTDNVVYFSGIAGSSEVLIYSIDGKLIDHIIINNKMIDVHHLQSGLYHLEIRTKNGIAHRKLIINK